MVSYFQGLHTETRPVFLDNFNYMLRQNEQYAEEKGGVDALTDDQRRIYEGRRRRLTALANYSDACESLIESMQEWIDELITKNRQLASQIREQNAPWQQLAQNNPDGFRETMREQSHIRARLLYPELY